MQTNVDNIAEKLIQLGRMGRSMPAQWDAFGKTIPVRGLGGEYAGKVLPGKGLYLDMDLKTLGITKTLPYVFERTPVQRVAEFVKDHRLAVSIASAFLAAQLMPSMIPAALFGAITTYDSIINARAGGNATDICITKASTTTVANAWHSLFTVAGMPSAGSYTGTPGSACDKSTAGAWSQGLSNPTGGNKAFLLTLGFTAAQQVNILMLIDLLVQVGALAVNNGTATVSSAALTRQTTGAGVMMAFEVTTVLSATAAGNMTVSYTNQAGTSGQTAPSVALTVSAAVGRVMPSAFGPYAQLASGDTGVRAVASITTSGATATTGVMALNLYDPLAIIPGVATNCYIERDSTVQIDGLTEIAQTSGAVLGCLSAYVLPSTTSSGILTAFMRTVQG